MIIIIVNSSIITTTILFKTPAQAQRTWFVALAEAGEARGGWGRGQPPRGEACPGR
jgi:hypothetical protein